MKNGYQPQKSDSKKATPPNCGSGGKKMPPRDEYCKQLKMDNDGNLYLSDNIVAHDFYCQFETVLVNGKEYLGYRNEKGTIIVRTEN